MELLSQCGRKTNEKYNKISKFYSLFESDMEK